MIHPRSRQRRSGGKFGIRLTSGTVLAASLVLSAPLAAQNVQPPQPLPPYYDPIFRIGDMWMSFAEHALQNGVDGYEYKTPDGAITMDIELIKCNRSTCPAYYDNFFKAINGQFMGPGSAYKKITPTEMSFVAIKENRPVVSFVFRFRSSILINSYEIDFTKISARKTDNIDMEARFERITAIADRQRYEEALAAGNIAMGAWGPSIHRHARRLLKAGKKEQGIKVLRDLIATSPANYEAHIDFMNNAPDPASARSSAETVLRNAEDRALVAKAAAYLGRALPQLEDFPYLKRGLTGLQVILIPLPPVDASLLQASAKIFEKITDIPVKIRRLHQSWSFGPPDRPFVIFRGTNIDFQGKSGEQFTADLKASVTGNAFGEYLADRFVDELKQSKGQYSADGPLMNFLNLLSEYRSRDYRTMYVGITEANLYSGSARYVFSMHAGIATGSASIMSYGMMLAKTVEDPKPSRRRLTERIAKELVPASLKSLRIPRSADPTDPYSYSSGLARLDEKTLTLSAPLREALKKFR